MPGNYKVNSYRRSLTMRTASRYTNAETDEAVILLIPSTLYLQEFPIHQIYGWLQEECIKRQRDQ